MDVTGDQDWEAELDQFLVDPATLGAPARSSAPCIGAPPGWVPSGQPISSDHLASFVMSMSEQYQQQQMPIGGIDQDPVQQVKDEKQSQEGSSQDSPTPSTPATPTPAQGNAGGAGHRAWSDEEFDVLLMAKRQEAELCSGLSKAMARWRAIAGFCRAHGVERSGEQCKGKWDFVMAEYKKLKGYLQQKSSEGASPKSYFEMSKDERRGLDLPRNMTPHRLHALELFLGSSKPEMLLGSGKPEIHQAAEEPVSTRGRKRRRVVSKKSSELVVVTRPRLKKMIKPEASSGEGVQVENKGLPAGGDDRTMLVKKKSNVSEFEGSGGGKVDDDHERGFMRELLDQHATFMKQLFDQNAATMSSMTGALRDVSVAMKDIALAIKSKGV